MGVMICLGQGGLRSLSASSFILHYYFYVKQLFILYFWASFVKLQCKLQEGQIEMAESQVVDNQYKFVFTVFTIGCSDVSGAQ